MTMSVMTVPAIIKGSFVEDATITSSTEDASHADDNIADWDDTTYWESEGSDDTTPEWIRAEFSSSQNIDFVFLSGMNLKGFSVWYRVDSRYSDADSPYNNTTIKKTGAAWTVDEHIGRTVDIVSGTGNGQTAVVVSNTADTITITGTWSTVPDATSDFDILIRIGDAETAATGLYHRLQLSSTVVTDLVKVLMTTTQTTDAEKQITELMVGEVQLEQDYARYDEEDIEAAGAQRAQGGASTQWEEWTKKKWRVGYEFLTQAEWEAVETLKDARASFVFYGEPSDAPDEIYRVRIANKFKHSPSGRVASAGWTINLTLEQV